MSNSSSSVSNTIWKPNTFTIAEFIRSSRSFGSRLLAYNSLKWGIQHEVYIPIAVISDALSLIYRLILLLC